jgi:hypothetical protein
MRVFITEGEERGLMEAEGGIIEVEEAVVRRRKETSARQSSRHLALHSEQETVYEPHFFESVSCSLEIICIVGDLHKQNSMR